MSPEAILTNPSGPIHLLFKGGFLILVVMLIVFLLIAIKQIRDMNEILTQHELFPLIQGVAFVILFTALALFVLTIVIL